MRRRAGTEEVKPFKKKKGSGQIKLLYLCKNRFCRDYIGWIDEALQNGAAARESLLTESIAVGSKEFIEDIKTKIGSKAKGRQVRETNGKCTLVGHLPL